MLVFTFDNSGAVMIFKVIGVIIFAIGLRGIYLSAIGAPAVKMTDLYTDCLMAVADAETWPRTPAKKKIADEKCENFGRAGMIITNIAK